MAESPVLHSDTAQAPLISLTAGIRMYLIAKRGLDVFVAAIALGVLAPLWLLIALSIKLTSPGPVLYTEPREVGKDGKLFELHKFRTMYANNDNGIHREYYEKFVKESRAAGEHEGAQVFKITTDPRVTSVGRILRRIGLDEVPQFLNVLKDEMSVVGPRPAIYYEYGLYEDWHKQRLTVKPGITGLYQVTARSRVPFDEMVRIDLEYIRRRSLRLDLEIMLRTVYVMVLKKGGY